MKKIYSITLVVALIIVSVNSFAGNEQRAGQAGASEILINPWAASSGWANAGSSTIHGIESLFHNVAGLSFTKKSELAFSRTNWFQGTEIYINNFGFAQKIGEEGGVVSMAFTSMDFGTIDITTVENPDGTGGTFHPTYSTITLAYAKDFSNSIHGGLGMKIINEGIYNLKAAGVAIDAGIIYLTGIGKNKLGKRKKDNFSFGISLKNVGPTMKYSGDGISFRGSSSNGVIMTVQQRSDQFELPSLLKIGISYDIMLAPKVDTSGNKITTDHLLTLAGTFTSNSFTKDIISFGARYKFKNLFVLRAGYQLESGGNSTDVRTINYTGPTAGVSVQVPLSKEKGSFVSIDYSYRDTEIFSGVHTFGVRVIL